MPPIGGTDSFYVHEERRPCPPGIYGGEVISDEERVLYDSGVEFSKVEGVIIGQGTDAQPERVHVLVVGDDRDRLPDVLLAAAGEFKTDTISITGIVGRNVGQ